MRPLHYLLHKIKLIISVYTYQDHFEMMINLQLIEVFYCINSLCHVVPMNPWSAKPQNFTCLETCTCSS